jgi:CHASE2 domain-containing sensor protein
MSGLQKRGGYMPRRSREQRAYRLVIGGSTAGAIGIVSLVLAIAGLIGYALPVIALIVAAICMLSFRNMTRPRR